MKHYVAPLIFLIVFASCRNSPATHVVGKYNGNYHIDSIPSGTATANVMEINSLTVNIGMDLQNHPDFQMQNVQVDGEGEIYTLYYSGTEGELNGSCDHDHMSFILVNDEDTIYFQGDR